METNLQPRLAPETFNLIGMGQHEQFKAAVLKHLRDELGNEEWGRFRRISRRHSGYSKYLGQAIPPNITPLSTLSSPLHAKPGSPSMKSLAGTPTTSTPLK